MSMGTKFLCLLFLLLLAGAVANAHLNKIIVTKEGSSVTYHLVHPLHTIEATSKDVMYRVNLDEETKQIVSVSAQVDVTSFDSGNSNRDSHAMEVIDALTFPAVTFSSTGIIQTGDSLDVTGKLTFHGVTKSIVMIATSKWTTPTLVIQGQFNLSLTEFKIERPSLLMIPVNDTLKFSLNARFELK
jgi:polyisoprenoid-binding protein YceI